MKQLLLIEDNAANRKLIGGVLLRAGYQVDEFDNADDGIAMALQKTYDLIVMDIQLPGTDGLAATRLLRASDKTQHIPILAVTAYAMPGDQKRILEGGCDDYLAKPIAYKELLKKVELLLGGEEAVALLGKESEG
ncbi:MAG: response regulator [Deltaproteobacteria bacterium]|nr:response regulator [Deltaproteobacteria bacterium]|tara:strand:- start:2872 stop:3276 length:405 start_codon:yes stop_codon:yes gene_type:complete